ncbi:hypothetical protein RRG08_043015 [Elysia crispata]|uniref:Uncharacterized protein n=1 Tax=Elysia crispata TaxID=231223 RepID=A0AAE0XXW1_9GAST|nr:hypothetical protein RRG08_043015 [Elysia crispata]
MLCVARKRLFNDIKGIEGDYQLCEQYLTCENFELKVTWKKWENQHETKKKVLVEKSASFHELIGEFLEGMTKYPLHTFRALWQHKERSHPPFDKCISVRDFAENHGCSLQDEIQSAHWSYSQETIHPVVNHYTCHDCNKVVTIVSDDLKHDTAAVLGFSKKVYDHLSSKGYSFNRINQWKDGCGAQYKCKDAFHDLTQMNKWANKFERNFFGSRHGKNACVGESVVTERSVKQAVKSRRVVIQLASDFFAFCKTHLMKPDLFEEKCCHYRRDFHLCTWN